jgi:biotin carboxyl carrier protein
MPDATSPSAAHAELTALRRFAGPSKEFWPRFAAALADVCESDRCILAAKQGAENATWKKLHDWAHNEIPSTANAAFNTQLIQLADRAASTESGFSAALAGGHVAIGARLPLPNASDTAVALLLLTGISEERGREILGRLLLASDTPLMSQQMQGAATAQADTQKFAGTLDILAQFNEQSRFLASALALCNSVATRFACDRVSLGWVEGPNLKLKSISRTEKFNRQMAAAQALEIAMEEAVDQNADLVFPASPDSPHISRDHAKFSEGQGVANVASFPVRLGERPVACITCERQDRAFIDQELQQLRLTVDLAARRLADLQRHDRWFGARWATRTKELFAAAVGPQHTWAKVTGLLVLAAILALVFVRLPYRVEANFIVRTDDLAYLSSPFDGYLNEVLMRPGDSVTNGQVLLRLDTKDLLLEEGNALADIVRYQREMEKARASRALSEMRIAEAMGQQAQARLDLVRHRLEQAAIRAPFDGVVVEGDLRDRLGAPVKQGDALVRVAKLKSLFVQVDVPERDIHELTGKDTGEIAFFSQPRLKFPVSITTLEPAAMAKESGNVFQARCTLQLPPEAWFRPGMSGVAKIDVGPRRLIWILTHRTIDFLRIYFWW